MNVDSLIEELRDLGIKIALTGTGDLKLLADPGVMSESIRRSIRESKPELIEWILENGETNKSIEFAKVKRETLENIPLSHAQRRMWLVDHMGGGSGAYNIASAYRISGPLDVDRLTRSLHFIVDRHASLRTTYHVKDGLPCQKVHDQISLDIRVINQSPGSIDSFLEAETARPFDLDAGPVFRCRIIKVNRNEHIFYFCVHHIAFDGWSNAVFMDELWTFYMHPPVGENVLLPDLQYTDYVYWQHYLLASSRREKSLQFWRNKLRGCERLSLPTDRSPSGNMVRGGCHWHTGFDRSLVELIKSRSRIHGVTLYTWLLSVFYVLLQKYSGQKDISIGTDVAGRSTPELEKLIGYFVNQLVLRLKVNTESSFDELLKEVKSLTLDAYSHQDLPFDILVEELAESRDMSQSPFFPVKFTFQNAPHMESPGDGVKVENIPVRFNYSKLDMTWSFIDSEDGLRLLVEYDTDLYDESTVEDMFRHYESILRTVTDDSRIRINRIPFIAEENSREISSRLPPVKPLAKLLEQQTDIHADKRAVFDSVKSYSYAKLNAASNRLARYLQRRGITCETNVITCMHSSVDYITTVCALSKLGAVLVPVDPKIPADRLATIRRSVNAGFIISTANILAEMGFSDFESHHLVDMNGVFAEAEKESEQNLNLPWHQNQLAYIVFTSGTTGAPKGVMVTVAGLNSLAREQEERFQLGPDCTVLQFSSIGFDASIWEILMALGSGASLACEQKSKVMPGQQLAEFIARHQVTHITLPPSALAVMKDCELSRLKVMILAGEACQDGLLKPWCGKLRLFNGYGPSEATICASIADFNERCGGFSSSVGFPVAGNRIYILSECGERLPQNVPGELCISGISLATGYCNDPAKTAEKFLPDPFTAEAGRRMYCTGDRARIRWDGSIEFMGRIDTQVKLRGYRIELKEIESQLLASEKVVQAVATLNQQEQMLVAYVVTHAPVDEIALKNSLRKSIPEYMIPSRIHPIKEVPVTVNGKIDYSALPKCVEEEEYQIAHRETLNVIEKELSELWRKLVGRTIGKNINFFDAGGNSLLMVKLQESLRRELEKVVSIDDLFRYSTIASLAYFLETGESNNVFSGQDERLSKKMRARNSRSRRDTRKLNRAGL